MVQQSKKRIGSKAPIKKIIQGDKWYLVDTINHKEPRLVRIDFNTKQDVINRIKYNLHQDIRWDYISGEMAILNKLKFKRRGRNMGNIHVDKYEYSPELLTRQERKSFRTKFRRYVRKEN